VTILLFLAVVFCEACHVAGQIFFKHAMSGHSGVSAGRVIGLTAGIFVMTIGFFFG
jgi:hypothetical protein